MIVLTDFHPFGPQTPAPFDPAPQTDQSAPLPLVPGLRTCVACTCRSEARQVVPGAGPVDARIMVIGQNPGSQEDTAGTPFIGEGGDELNSWLQVLGLDRAKLFVTNVVKCHTTANRVPRMSEIKTCAGRWLNLELAQLTELQVLLPMGKPAVIAILGRDAPPMTPLMAHHYRIRVHDRELRVFPLPHPAYLLRAKHLAPMFKEIILGHVRLTLQRDALDAYEWSKRSV